MVPVDATPGQIIQATAPSDMLVYVQIPDKIRGGMVIFVEDPGQPKDPICDRVWEISDNTVFTWIHSNLHDDRTPKRLSGFTLFSTMSRMSH